jgi:hypothetical protein
MFSLFIIYLFSISQKKKSIGHIQSNEEIWGEDGRDTYGKEDPTLAAKEILLYGGHDRGVTKYGFSFNTRSHGEITSP